MSLPDSNQHNDQIDGEEPDFQAIADDAQSLGDLTARLGRNLANYRHLTTAGLRVQIKQDLRESLKELQDELQKKQQESEKSIMAGFLRGFKQFSEVTDSKVYNARRNPKEPLRPPGKLNDAATAIVFPPAEWQPIRITDITNEENQLDMAKWFEFYDIPIDLPEEQRRERLADMLGVELI